MNSHKTQEWQMLKNCLNKKLTEKHITKTMPTSPIINFHRKKFVLLLDNQGLIRLSLLTQKKHMSLKDTQIKSLRSILKNLYQYIEKSRFLMMFMWKSQQRKSFKEMWSLIFTKKNLFKKQWKFQLSRRFKYFECLVRPSTSVKCDKPSMKANKQRKQAIKSISGFSAPIKLRKLFRKVRS